MQGLLRLRVDVPTDTAIEQSHKSQNAPVPYPTIYHSEQKRVHFCSEWCIAGYGIGAFGDLGIRSIVANCDLQHLQIKWKVFTENLPLIVVETQHERSHSKCITGKVCCINLSFFLHNRCMFKPCFWHQIKIKIFRNRIWTTPNAYKSICS